MTPTPVTGAALPPAAAPVTPTPRRRYHPADHNELFHELYDLYRRLYHPAVAAIEAELGARRRINHWATR